MTTTCFGSIKAKVIRITRADDCGVPVSGAKSTVVSDGFIKVDIKPTYEAGTEFLQRNAWGDFCINEEDKPRLKRITVAIDFCKVDPDVLEIVTGARLLTATSNAVGGVISENPPGGRFALECWSKVPGSTGCAGSVQQWVYWLLPNLGYGQLGQVTLDLSAVTFSFQGDTNGAAASTWSAGATPATTGVPYAASYLPATATINAGDHFAFATTAVAPPTAACGAIALP